METYNSSESPHSHIEEGVESLYLPYYRAGRSKSRVLEAGKGLSLEDGSTISVLPERTNDSARVVEYNPNGTNAPNTIILGVNGYMMPQTAMMTEEVLGGQSGEVMRANNIAYWGYVHAQRGKESVLEDNGRHTVQDILDQVAREIGEVFANLKEGTDVILDGHSQGGQIVAHILKKPERFGLSREQIRGAILRHSVPIPDSTRTWLAKNTVPSAVKNLMAVVKSAVTKQGLLFRGDKVDDLFFDGKADRTDPRVTRILEGTSPAEGGWFLETLLARKGNSPFFKRDELAGTNLVVMAGSHDHLFPEKFQRRTANYLDKAGANVEYLPVDGGHFASILGGERANKSNAEALERFF